MGHGVLFALDAEDGRQMAEAESDAELIAVVGRVEARWDESWLEELHEAWDPLHRCLSDGTLKEDGEYPLSFAIFGTEVYDGYDRTVCYVAATTVADIAEALKPLDEQWLRERYRTVDFVGYQGVRSEQDLAYTVATFAGLKRFYQRAREAGRAVVFTVDQRVGR